MLTSSILAFVEQQTGAPRDDGLLLYGKNDLAERNQTFEIGMYLPDHLLIGDDSGGRGVLVHCNNANHPVYLFDPGAMDEDDLCLLAESLDQWLASGCPIPRQGAAETVPYVRSLASTAGYTRPARTGWKHSAVS